MHTIAVRALSYQNYKGRWYKIGDVIQVDSEAEVADMVSMHMAQRMAVVHVSQQTAVIHVAETYGDVAVDTQLVEAVPSTKDVKRYKHREMRTGRA